MELSFTKKDCSIAIVDTGINLSHPLWLGKREIGVCFKKQNDIIVSCDDIQDHVGHGTAIHHIITQCCPEAMIYTIKITDSISVDEELISYALEYIYENLKVDVINISVGFTALKDLNRLNDICEKIKKNGTVICSAFDNNGGISYPAAFPNVIGVDTSSRCVTKEQFEYVESRIINILGKGTSQRLAWINPDYIIDRGSSFACAYISSLVLKLYQNGTVGLRNVLKELKNRSVKYHKKTSSNTSNLRLPFCIHKAILFPYNKEMESLIRFSDLLNFEIVSVYDLKYSAKIGKSIQSKTKLYAIKNIEKIDWDSFDTLILGHVGKISEFGGNGFKIDALIETASRLGKNLFLFDKDLVQYNTHNYYSYIDKGNVPQLQFGKMFDISLPIISIMGTSSSQGKFTVQLNLRRNLQKNGYRIGQIGTEPTSLLYGMDFAYPMGYNSSVSISGYEAIYTINSMLNKIEMMQPTPEVIIVGSQSGTIPYDFANMNMFTQSTIEFLIGTLPDAVILCVNPYDTFDYIRRTIDFIQSVASSKIIALAFYPMDVENSTTTAKRILCEIDTLEMINELKNIFQLPIFNIFSEDEMQQLTDYTIDYLAE